MADYSISFGMVSFTANGEVVGGLTINRKNIAKTLAALNFWATIVSFDLAACRSDVLHYVS